MIGRLLGLFGGLFAYVAIGTLIAQIVIGGYLWLGGYLTREKLVKMTAVAQGADLDAIRDALVARQAPETGTQMSPEDLARARAARCRDLELRQQVLIAMLSQANAEQAKVVEEVTRYRQLKSGFEKELASLREAAFGASQETARLILENMKPVQAKEQIMRMVNASEMDSVVTLLSAMPATKRSKVIAEFKTEDESRTLAEILKLIRDGVPELTLIDKTRGQLPAGGLR